LVVKAIPATNCLSETLSSAKGESSSDERIESGLTKIQPIGSDGFLTFILSGAHSRSANIGSAENSDSDENINNSIETDSSQTK
jgi:hypothetical protein